MPFTVIVPQRNAPAVVLEGYDTEDAAQAAGDKLANELTEATHFVHLAYVVAGPQKTDDSKIEYALRSWDEIRRMIEDEQDHHL